MRRWVVTAQRLPSVTETRPGSVVVNWFVEVPDDEDTPLAALEAARTDAIRDSACDR